MWFPKQSPKINPARFANNSSVIYTDKEGNKHTAKVLESFFTTLFTGYRYKIELDEEYNGHKNYIVVEKRLTAPEKKTTKKKESAV